MRVTFKCFLRKNATVLARRKALIKIYINNSLTFDNLYLFDRVVDIYFVSSRTKEANYIVKMCYYTRDIYGNYIYYVRISNKRIDSFYRDLKDFFIRLIG